MQFKHLLAPNHRIYSDAMSLFLKHFWLVGTHSFIPLGRALCFSAGFSHSMCYWPLPLICWKSDFTEKKLRFRHHSSCSWPASDLPCDCTQPALHCLYLHTTCIPLWDVGVDIHPTVSENTPLKVMNFLVLMIISLKPKAASSCDFWLSEQRSGKHGVDNTAALFAMVKLVNINS